MLREIVSLIALGALLKLKLSRIFDAYYIFCAPRRATLFIHTA
jgi:hypothetical protein